MRVRSAAVEALGKLGRVTTTYIPQITARQIADRLEDKDPSVRSSATWALGHLGEVANAYIPQIAERLEDNDPSVRSILTFHP